MHTTSGSGGSRDLRALPFLGCPALCALCVHRIRHYAAQRTASHAALRHLLFCAIRRVRHRGELDHVLRPPLGVSRSPYFSWIPNEFAVSDQRKRTAQNATQAFLPEWLILSLPHHCVE